jgi:ribosomal protein L11 methyltransferase
VVNWRRGQLVLPPALASFIEERLLLAGWERVASERRPGEQQVTLSVFVAADAELPEAARLAGWLDEARAAGLAAPALAWSEAAIRDEDWGAGFRAHFAARTLAPGIAILPSWERPPGGPPAGLPGPGAPLAIVLEPGQAFGTGEHPTTALCLEALQGWMAQRGAEGPRCLDVGCGTGVLSIAARLWGAGQVRGYDIEPAAVVNAYLNAELNGLAGQIEFVWGEATTLAPAAWDLLLCNLYLGPILRLLPRLDAALAPGAGALLSGFLRKQARRISEAAGARGWELQAEVSRDEWVAQTWRKPAPAPQRP